jgi:hypothetical protein
MYFSFMLAFEGLNAYYRCEATTGARTISHVIFVLTLYISDIRVVFFLVSICCTAISARHSV